MAQYKAYLVQDGEGCDYTIACGHLMIDLESNNMEDAVRELAEIIRSEYSHEETRLERAIVIEVTRTVNMSLYELYKEVQKEREEKRIKEKEAKELAELERLQKKYTK